MKHLTPSSLLLLVVALIGNISLPSRGLADTTLQAKLVPAITVSGPLGSLQQVQYTTNPGDSNSWAVLSQVRLDTPAKAFYDETASDSAKRFYRTKMIGIADTNLVWIPPGTFMMGSPTNEVGRITTGSGSEGGEGPQTLVTLTKGFLMGRYEVRNAEWLVYRTNMPAASQEDTNSTFYQRAVSLGTTLPSIYSNASNYCVLRTADEQARGLIPAGWYYRLPTEAEWEYACRAGSTTPFAIGGGLELRNDGVRQDAAFDGTAPYPTNVVPVGPISYPGISYRPAVGSFTPNAFGLYDMHGNALELCWDFLGDNLPGGSVTNLIGVVETNPGFKLVGRGGSAFQFGSDCRSARRRMSSGLLSSARLGFRVVLIPTDN